jgi:hypothetical protein
MQLTYFLFFETISAHMNFFIKISVYLNASFKMSVLSSVIRL